MLDRRHQNKGIGQAALPMLVEEIKAHGLCEMIEIYYDPKNIAAKTIYERFGLTPVGHRDDGDVLAEIQV